MLRAYSAGVAVVLLIVSVVGCAESERIASHTSAVPEGQKLEDARKYYSNAESARETGAADYAALTADAAPPVGAVPFAGAGSPVAASPVGASPVAAEPASATERKFAATPPLELERAARSDALNAVPLAQREQDDASRQRQPLGGDQYDQIVENGFIAVNDAPLSTFSIDVDTASYSKTRMYLQQRNCLPPPDAVRIEELLNYFDYEYSPPVGDDPFAVHLEVARAPWQPQHLLARVGIKGREMNERRPASNLVFLIDVSGSMNHANKLGLVKAGLQLLTSQLNDEDRVSIVVYAGAAGLVLPPTHGDNRHVIMDAVERLAAGGSTNGGQGIRLAYQVARQNFIKGGVNRVLLCTDGDFNVGTTNTGDLVRLAEGEAREGVFLSVLGFGMGNHNDAMLEELSNKANGNYAFIDGDREARKVLLDQLDSTLVTIAKDVKIQVEFNPAYVASYRLIGYENRHLEDRDFNDDKKDAGEIGAGHTVTALYEIVLADGEEEAADPKIDPLKYQTPRELARAADGDELLNLKLRFKRPSNDRSELVVYPVQNAPLEFGQATRDFQFAAAVAEFGMLLRNSRYRGDASYAEVLEIAGSSLGRDGHGYRSEFLEMVNTARRLVEPEAAAALYLPAAWHGTPQVGGVAPFSRPSPALSWRMLLALAVVVWLIVAVAGFIVVVWAIFATHRQHAWHSEPEPVAKMVRSPSA